MIRKWSLLSSFFLFGVVLASFGTGFSLFYFAEKEKEIINRNEVEVEKKYPSEFGHLKVSFFDEDGKEETNPTLLIAQNDIEMAESIELEFAFSSTFEENSYDFSSFSYSFVYEISINEELKDYFQFDYPYSTTSSSIKGYWYGTGPVLKKDLGDIVKASLTVSITYKSGMNPTSYDDFKTLSSKINHITTPYLTYSFSFIPTFVGGKS